MIVPKISAEKFIYENWGAELPMHLTFDSNEEAEDFFTKHVIGYCHAERLKVRPRYGLAIMFWDYSWCHFPEIWVNKFPYENITFEGLNND